MASCASGRVLLITDNKAAVQKALDVSAHSGFHTSLQIAKKLSAWLLKDNDNAIEFWWFPGHCGLLQNEVADRAASTTFPRVAPAPSITTASRLCAHKLTAVLEWHADAMSFLEQHRI